MPNGINLTLMIGPVVPEPVSKEVLDALISVEVFSRTDNASGFKTSAMKYMAATVPKIRTARSKP